MGTPALTFRRFGVLVEQLPPEARTLRAMTKDAPKKMDGDAKVDEWPLEAQLLALIHDTLAVANWQRGGGKGKPTTIVQKRRRSTSRPTLVSQARIRAHLKSLGH